MLSSTAPAAIDCTQVSQVFLTKAGVVHALEDIDLTVRQGEFVSIVGPSGCGKSTLLKLIAGLQKNTFGDIVFEGTTVDRPQTNVGIVFQQDALLEWRSALDNVLLQIEMRGRRRREDTERARALLASVGLAGFEDSLPHQLSGGMRQRVAICRALIHEPPVLLMDEPFGALDALTREQLMIDLQRMWMSTGMSVVFITHSIQEAVYLSDRVVVMGTRPGRIIEEIPLSFPRPRPIDLLADPEFTDTVAHIRTHLGTVKEMSA